MNGSSPEEDKGLRQGQIALLEKAAVKAKTLHARANAVSGAGTSVVRRRAEALTRLVERNSHLLEGVGVENAAAPEEEAEMPTEMATPEAPAVEQPTEAPTAELTEEEPEKEVKLSAKTWGLVEEGVASVIMHDGKIENDDGESPVAQMMAENGWTRTQWDRIKPAIEKLGLLSLNREGVSHTPYDSITLEPENIRAIEGLIAEDKLPDYLLEPLQDIKIRLAQEAVEKAGGK